MPEDVYVKTVGDALKHRAALMLGILLASTFVGGALWWSAPRVYQADARLYVSTGRQGLASDFSDGVLTRYYLQQASSPEVLSRAGAILGGESFHTVAGSVTANAINGANIIIIRGRSSRPDRAIRRANAVARALIEQNGLDANARLRLSRAYLNDELDRLDAALKQPGRAVKDLDMLRSQYLKTYERLTDLTLESTRTADGLTLLEAASSADYQAGSGTGYLIGTLIVGLCLATFAGLIAERFDDRLRGPEGLAQAAGVRLVLRDSASPKALASGSNRLLAVALGQISAAYPQAQAVLVVAATSRDERSTEGIGNAFTAAARDLLEPTPEFTPSPSESISRLRIVSITSLGDLPAAWSRQSADIAIIVATAGSTTFEEARTTASLLRQVGVAPVAAVLSDHAERFSWRSHGTSP